MGFGITHIILLLIVVLVVFGAGRLPQVMGDLGKGVRNFKAGLNGEHGAVEKPDTDNANKPLPPPSSPSSGA
ncbi:MAG: twin-arginine translocase TatA/TatE family subunit [Alphaproteobacteria bacterium]|nr:twin-arginine translocase TatA/TatE family subunit [Alphaproteobacteria bacterium]